VCFARMTLGPRSFEDPVAEEQGLQSRRSDMFHLTLGPKNVCEGRCASRPPFLVVVGLMKR